MNFTRGNISGGTGRGMGCRVQWGQRDVDLSSSWELSEWAAATWGGRRGRGEPWSESPFQLRQEVEGSFRKETEGTSLTVQWLRLLTPTAGARVPSLVGEAHAAWRSRMPCRQPEKEIEKNRVCRIRNECSRGHPGNVWEGERSKCVLGSGKRTTQH